MPRPMRNDDIRELTLALLRAEKADDVIKILDEASFWQDLSCWRLYGERDNNYATIGNQQSRPEAALAEKVINSIDARLLDECLKRDINPMSAAAPSTMKAAVSLFFEGRELTGDRGGMMQDWDQTKQLDEAQNITIAVTGSRGRSGSPCITIADTGEGQTPTKVPETFLSIDRANKLRIPFVQGKFNMGGTGALKFCGEHKLQLLITRRDPAFSARTDPNDPFLDRWSVTVVRRDRPTQGVGQVRNSVYRYLAPVDAEKRPENGRLLTFEASELPLMPVGNKPYERAVSHGSAIKLYEYDMKGFGSNALMKDGLLFRLELLLPGIALPVRVHECRNFSGHSGSFANSLVGLIARLQRNLGDNVESGFPAAVPFGVRGESLMAKIYAFKDGRADTYRDNEGVIFVINGQTHGYLPKTFFQRSAVKMDRLAESLLVVVDCSQLSVSAREDLFMNSRDRLSGGELRKAVEKELEDLIKSHASLRDLRERRRAEEISKRLEESKPLEDVLGSILKKSPTLARLFLAGQRLSRPHPAGRRPGDGTGPGGESGKKAFVGQKHPTFFRFERQKYGEILERTTERGRRCRIRFVTDVEDAYFSRVDTGGRYHVEVLDGPGENLELDHNLILEGGVANWSISLPDGIDAGDHITVQCTVEDDVLLQPFVNVVRLTVTPKSERPGGQVSERKPRAGGGHGEGEDEDDTGIQLPPIIRVKVGDSNWTKYKFDDSTACRVVVDAEGEGDNEKEVYTFYINVDNKYLATDLKGTKEDVRVQESKFIYGNVCIGLGLLHDRKLRHNNGGASTNGDEKSMPDIVASTTRAVAPFLVPMIDFLGALTPEEVGQLAQIGDEE
jgi:hypothetical protein